MNRQHRTFLVLLLVIFSSSSALAGDNSAVIERLSNNIQKAENSAEKSRLHIFRARNYAQKKEWEKALEDYNTALELNHQGWIHLERSRFLMAAGRYRLAYEDAVTTKKETPTLTHESDKIIAKALAKLHQQYDAENPPTIVLDTVVDPNRKTRFDVMEERGVYANKERKIQQLMQNNKASRERKAVASPKSRKSPTRKRG